MGDFSFLNRDKLLLGLQKGDFFSWFANINSGFIS